MEQRETNRSIRAAQLPEKVDSPSRISSSGVGFRFGASGALLGLYRGYIGVILGYWDNGENANDRKYRGYI